MMPNFIIIGAPRAGTTSLYHYLNQHPQISMSKIKETNFFTYLASQVESDYQIRPNSTWPVTTFSQYEALFDIKKNTKAIGEASPAYLYTPNIPKLINKHLPNVKLILILRNPIERAYSSYLKDCREGVEKRSFEVAVTEEIQDPKKNIASINFYIRAGLYFEHLTRFLEYFDSSQIKILFQEDLYKEPSFVLRNLFDYLEVDNQFVPDTTVRFNEAIPPLFIKKTSMRQAMKKWTSKIRQWLPSKLYFSLLNMKYKVNKKISAYPALSVETKTLLREQFVADVKKLQSYTERDLSAWLVVK